MSLTSSNCAVAGAETAYTSKDLDTVEGRLKSDPDDAAALEEKARILVGLGRFEEGRDAARRCIALDGYNIQMWQLMARLALEFGKPEEALEASLKILEVRQNDVDGLLHKARSLVRLTRAPEGLLAVATAAQYAPELARVWLSHGLTLEKMRRHEEAVDSWKKAVELDPSHQLARAFARATEVEAARLRDLQGTVERNIGILSGSVVARRAILNLALYLLANPDSIQRPEVIRAAAHAAWEAARAVLNGSRENSFQDCGQKVLDAALSIFELSRATGMNAAVTRLDDGTPQAEQAAGLLSIYFFPGEMAAAGERPLSLPKAAAANNTARRTALAGMAVLVILLAAGAWFYMQHRTAVLEDSDPMAARLVITSQPSGARVFINNQDQGVTPLTVRNLRESQVHVVRLQSAGSDSAMKGIKLKPGKNKLHMTLDAAPGQVALTGSPIGADIYVDGEPFGTLGDGSMTLDLNPGKHAIELRGAGHKAARKEVMVETGKTAPVRLELKSIMGTLSVTGVEGARVMLDGVSRGKVPLTLHLLPPGAHKVRVDMPSYRAFERNVTLESGQVTEVSVPQLEPLPVAKAATTVQTDSTIVSAVPQAPGTQTSANPTHSALDIGNKTMAVTPESLTAAIPPGGFMDALTVEGKGATNFEVFDAEKIAPGISITPAKGDFYSGQAQTLRVNVAATTVDGIYTGRIVLRDKAKQSDVAVPFSITVRREP